METDYISREAARPDAFCDGVSCQECPFLKNSVTGGCRVDDFIKAIPAADVRPIVKGEWIKNESTVGWHCSVCKGDNIFAYSWNSEKGKDEFQDSYCPNCGADMRGDT